MIRIILCLLLVSQAAAATEVELAKALAALTGKQQTILYQYGTLQTYAGPGAADSFWVHHREEVAGITKENAGLMARELLANTSVAYTAKKPSRLQALRGVFTASRLLLGLAALIAAYSLIHLLSRYWSRITAWLIRVLAPLFRHLFTPQLLTWQLLLLSLAGVYYGPLTDGLVVRTIIIHVGVVTLWAQVTAIVTRKYYFHLYLDVVGNSFKDITTGAALVKVCLPALLATLALVAVIIRCPDEWYLYEITIPAMMALLSFPLVRILVIPLSRVLLPFTSKQPTVEKRLAGYVIATMIVWAALLYIPAIPAPVLVTVTIFVIMLLLLISIDKITSGGIQNYIWVQVVTMLFLCAVILAGAQRQILLLNWIGLGAWLLYIFIKYWEVPMIAGYSWKNRKAWGTLGLALIIWGIARLIAWHPEWFIFS